MKTSTSQPNWSPLKKITFRLVFIYFSLFIIVENNGAYPFMQFFMKKPTEWLHQFIPWVGEHFLNISYAIRVGPNGSGDTTYDYVLIFVCFIIGVLGTVIWSFLDRKRINYSKLYYWFTVVIRFYVGLMLINYGLVKIVKLQFPYPDFIRLLQAYGDSSPMGIAWTFLGFSKGYNIFMGVAEVLAGLLLFRRTLTIGAIITLMATMNVMAVNYFYDVPVKILSTHLVLMTLILLSKNIQQLLLFFFTDKSVQLSIIKRPDFSKRRMNKGLNIIKFLLLGFVFISGINGIIRSNKTYGEASPKPPMYGLYKVLDVSVNNDSLHKLSEVNPRWEYIAIERVGGIQVINKEKESTYYKSEFDTVKKNVKLMTYRDSTVMFSLDYMKKGTRFIFKTDRITLETERLTKEDFLLTNRGFNWINERPYNR
jgi:hypothetical protein